MTEHLVSIADATVNYDWLPAGMRVKDWHMCYTRAHIHIYIWYSFLFESNISLVLFVIYFHIYFVAGFESQKLEYVVFCGYGGEAYIISFFFSICLVVGLV